jgi:hypothetical protein
MVGRNAGAGRDEEEARVLREVFVHGKGAEGGLNIYACPGAGGLELSRNLPLFDLLDEDLDDIFIDAAIERIGAVFITVEADVDMLAGREVEAVPFQLKNVGRIAQQAP